jgi:hypothetical protein
VSLPRVTHPPAQAQAPQRTGPAMAAGLPAVGYASMGFMTRACVLSLPYERILREWDEFGFDQAVLDLVFHANAERVPGL